HRSSARKIGASYVHHEKTSLAAYGTERNGSSGLPPTFGSHGSCTNASEQNSGDSAKPSGMCRSGARGRRRHNVRDRNEPPNAQSGRTRLRVHTDPETA